MSVMQVFKDVAGIVINVGPWDDKVMPVWFDPNGSQLAGEPPLDADGKALDGYVQRDVTTNPLPEGAYEAEHDMQRGADGGLYADVTALRRVAYQPTPEQIGAIWKIIQANPDLVIPDDAKVVSDAVLQVKSEYPTR